MSRGLVLLLLALLLSVFVSVAYSQKNCGGVPNTNSIYTANPVFVKSVKNGHKYIAGQGADSIYLLHVYGKPYDWGYAVGELMKDELKDMMPTYFKYLDNQIETAIDTTPYTKYLPKFMIDFIAINGLKAGLDLTADFTKDYTPDRFNQEIKGLADATGIDAKSFTQLNMLPEMVKAGCSIVGAWNNATSTSLNGALTQLRALDWDVDAPIKKYPTVVIYHPEKGDGHPFATIGWPGFVGIVTGFSSAPIGLSEKVWLTDDSIDSRFGIPWTYMLRDILQYAQNLDDALDMMINANRTCSIHFGIGDGNWNSFRGVEYSHKILNVYDDENQPSYEAHPHMDGVVYWDKHKQPSGDPCLGSLLQKYYGNLNAETMIKYIAAQSATGNTQTAMYDYNNDYVYIAYPRADGEPGPLNAYERQHTRFDMRSLWNVAPPTQF